MCGPVRTAAHRWGGSGCGLQPWCGQPAAAGGGRRWPRWRPPSSWTRPSPSGTLPWRCSATSSAPPSTSRRGSGTPGCTPAAAPSASAATSRRSPGTSPATPAPWCSTCAGTPRTPCCSRSRSRPSRSPVSRPSPRTPGRSSSAARRRTATTGGSAACSRSCGRSRAASTRRWSCPACPCDVEPGAGHSAHARAHAHYETGDHAGGLAWMDGWITGAGAQVDNLCHFSWHAAMHELSMGDLDAVRLPVRRAAAAAARLWGAATWWTAARCCGAGR